MDDRQKRKIPLAVKLECINLLHAGERPRAIYDNYFKLQHDGMSYATFERVFRKWRAKYGADLKTLRAGTYDGFVPHDATVQIDGNGQITQAWIKQSATEIDWNEIIEQFTDKITALEIKPPATNEIAMLEIPLFDMHFGVAKWHDYKDLLYDIVALIRSKKWQQINLIVGQDLIHNNDLRGHTAKGTQIEKIDMPQAWSDAWSFWNVIITAALENASSVYCRYSKGNHDECISWAFVKTLQAKYPQLIIDDTLKARKVIYWKNCFIGYGHCEYTTKPDELFKQFVMDYPQEFAESKVREIHTGHLHRESMDNGMFVRRLASAVPVDEWHDNNGYVTAHKRFQIFEWAQGRLKAIYYL